MSDAASSETAFDRFIRRTRELFARESDLEKRWTALDPILAELLADPQSIEASKRWRDCVPRDKRAENHLFYEDPDYGFVVNGLVVNAEGYQNIPRVHDHNRVYTLYGIIDGRQQIQRFERLDDGKTENHARIRKTVDITCGPGEIDLVRPYEIHSEDTVGDRAVAVIVRSELSEGIPSARYIPEKDYYWMVDGPVQNRISFY